MYKLATAYRGDEDKHFFKNNNIISRTTCEMYFFLNNVVRIQYTLPIDWKHAWILEMIQLYSYIRGYASLRKVLLFVE